MANKNNGLHLPGSFSSYPKGPKPKHYSPHAQAGIKSGSMKHDTPRNWAIRDQGFNSPAPRHWNISGDNFADRAPLSPKHQIQRGTMSAPPSPRHTYQKNDFPTPRSPGGAMTGYKEGKHVDADPFGNYYFKLTLGNAEVAYFKECSGLKSVSEVFEITEGGWSAHTWKRPGQGKWENIVLKFGSNPDTTLLAWRDSFYQQDWSTAANYKDGSIAVMNNEGKVVRRYNFTHAWPVSWEGPSFNSGGSDLAVETLEIAHSGLTVENVSPPE